MNPIRIASGRLLPRILERRVNNFSPLVRNFNMASPLQQYDIIHDKKAREFYIKIGEDKALLQYEITNKATGEADLFHTEVPQSFRGKGVAKILAKEALDYFSKESKVNFKLTCTYLQKYVQENTCEEYDKYIIH